MAQSARAAARARAVRSTSRHGPWVCDWPGDRRSDRAAVDRPSGQLILQQVRGHAAGLYDHEPGPACSRPDHRSGAARSAAGRGDNDGYIPDCATSTGHRGCGLAGPRSRAAPCSCGLGPRSPRRPCSACARTRPGARSRRIRSPAGRATTANRRRDGTYTRSCSCCCSAACGGSSPCHGCSSSSASARSGADCQPASG